MMVTPKLVPMFEWLIGLAAAVDHTSLEAMLDKLIGKDESDGEFHSPLYDYYFSESKLNQSPMEYLTYLEGLRAIRTNLTNYHSDQTPSLKTFIDFIDINRRIGNNICVTRPVVHSENSVNIMTAHKSKGLEFNIVYILNTTDSVWGGGARTRGRMIGYPENLPIAQAGDSDDERMRLFYVAATRARQELYITYSEKDDLGRNSRKAEFLLDNNWHERVVANEYQQSHIEAITLDWYRPLVDVDASLKTLLGPNLASYKLSVTHLQNFLDVTRGGPAMFLLNNLLHFPQAKSPNAAFGTAIHNTLQAAHNHVTSKGEYQPIEDIVSNFEKYLQNEHLAEKEHLVYLQKGSDDLRAFLDLKYDTFTQSQRTELDFANQSCLIDGAHLTGKLDVADLDQKAKTVAIIDYKTGRPASSWGGKDDFEKIKLHKYRQQLMFYQLLVKHSRDYHGFQVSDSSIQFVEPDSIGGITTLNLDFKNDELQNFAKLIKSVWHHVVNLDLPETSAYGSTYKGILEFEQDLIEKTPNID